MRPAPLTPERQLIPACPPCELAVDLALEQVCAFASGPGERAVYIGCACAGRPVQSLVSFHADTPMVAASVVKLALALAAVREHHDGNIDLLAPVRVQDVGSSAYRDSLATLPSDLELPLAHLAGMGLVTSANPIFDYLARVPAVLQRANTLHPQVTVASGFSDSDLDTGPVYDNYVSARAAAHLLVDLGREAVGGLGPLWWGLANGARTTRLVRALDCREDFPRGFYSANKTGSLSGVRNDVAVLVNGDRAMVVAALTHDAGDGDVVDAAMAEMGEALGISLW